MTADDYVWFTAPCPYCGNKLTNLKVVRDLWGAGAPGVPVGSSIVSCSGCGQQVAAHEERDPGGDSRLVVSMHTLPVGVAMPPKVVAERVEAPPTPHPTAPAESIDEFFERIVDPWKAANLDKGQPDFSSLAEAVEPYPPKWRGVAWQDVGRAQWGNSDWVPIAQCYVEALRHNSDPNFLGWDVFSGGGPQDQEADALQERIRARAQLDDAGRTQLVDDLRRYVGAPADPGQLNS